MRNSVYQVIEDELIQWSQEMILENHYITWNDMKKMAIAIAKHYLSIKLFQSFRATDGWLTRLLKRHNLKIVREEDDSVTQNARPNAIEKASDVSDSDLPIFQPRDEDDPPRLSHRLDEHRRSEDNPYQTTHSSSEQNNLKRSHSQHHHGPFGDTPRKKVAFSLPTPATVDPAMLLRNPWIMKNVQLQSELQNRLQINQLQQLALQLHLVNQLAEAASNQTPTDSKDEPQSQSSPLPSPREIEKTCTLASILGKEQTSSDLSFRDRDEGCPSSHGKEDGKS